VDRNRFIVWLVLVGLGCALIIGFAKTKREDFPPDRNHYAGASEKSDHDASWNPQDLSDPKLPELPTEPSTKFVEIITPLVDPAKLDALTGKRAATPRLRKICYWLKMAQLAGHDPNDIIAEAHAANDYETSTRKQVQRHALLRNVKILDELGCFDAAGMEKLQHGKAPIVTRGPYAGQLATVDHILPRSVVPELDNALFNLEFLPDKLNAAKGDKIGDRQRSLSRQWHAVGLLSDEGLRAVEGRR